MRFFFFFFNDTATTEIYTLSLHDALPIWRRAGRASSRKWGCRRTRWERSKTDNEGTHALTGHSHAAPRTPLESPCAARTTRVATGSELAPTANTWRGSSADVASGSPTMFDMPPPSTTTSGSSTLISDAMADRKSVV